VATKKTAKAEKTAKAPKLDADEKARADQEKHYASQAAKKDGAYEGDTENEAPYMAGYSE
jgi:hypothetical protein